VILANYSSIAYALYMQDFALPVIANLLLHDPEMIGALKKSLGLSAAVCSLAIAWLFYELGKSLAPPALLQAKKV
jgi:hypothetical protein